MSTQELGRNPLFVKGSRERRELAHRLKILRTYDRGPKKDKYKLDRGKAAYDMYLEGYAQSLAYVRLLDGTNIVLDIGAGTTRAISEISESIEGRGLDFRATVLEYMPGIKTYLGGERTHVTPAEILRGIEDNSVGLALAVYSITYSINPTAVIDRINQVLVPGGIFKGTFNNDKGKDLISALSTASKPFEQRLRRLNYDVAIGTDGLILAKKPGGNIGIGAQELLQADAQDKNTGGRTS